MSALRVSVLTAAIRNPLVRVAGILGLALTLCIMMFLQSTELKRERSSYLYLISSNNWAASQLQLELERFLSALDRYMIDAPGLDHDTLRTRFDILWSRLPILQTGPETSEFRNVEGSQALLADLGETLASLEPEVMALVDRDVSRYRNIRSALTRFQAPIHSITVELSSGTRAQALFAQIRESQRVADIYLWSMLGAVLLLVLHLALEVLHSSRQARRENAARRAAEAANRAKACFLAMIGHELRTPLNAIIGFSQIQSAEIFGPMPSKYREYADDIYISGKHLLCILNQIMDMAKFDAEKIELMEEEFRPELIMEDTLRMMNTKFIQKGLRISMHCGDANVTLQADPGLFKQIMINILSNAVKFTPCDGSIDVNMAVIDGEFAVAVTDSGPGIPAELQEKVFDPFFQIDQTHARHHDGIGLGLTLVKGLTELHGGQVAITSAPGSGTRIMVRFPAFRVRLAASSPRETEKQAAQA